MAVEVRENVPLAPLTTFQIGGVAQYFCEVRNEDEIREALQWASSHDVHATILGGGSNVLIADSGVNGLVIRITEGKWDLSGQGILSADAGCNLLHLIKSSGEHHWGGWEKLAGIPGTVGGAVRGNAGAFGSEIKDFSTLVRAFNRITGEIREFSTIECEFSYRQSFFKKHTDWIITHVALQLAAITPDASAAAIQETITERERRHLQNVRAAGSFFMNPVAPAAVVHQFETEKGVSAREGRVPAGWLIEKVGLKGFSIGGAVASEQHPNYLVNQSNATAADVLALSKQIRQKVLDRFAVSLVEEAAIM